MNIQGNIHIRKMRPPRASQDIWDNLKRTAGGMVTFFAAYNNFYNVSTHRVQKYKPPTNNASLTAKRTCWDSGASVFLCEYGPETIILVRYFSPYET